MAEELNENQANLEQEVNIEESDRIIFSCPSCGAALMFDPSSQKMTCPYCSSEVDIEHTKIGIAEKNFNAGLKLEGEDWAGDNISVKCEQCGATTIVDTYNLSSKCAFCGSPNIKKIDNLTGIKPESLIPFKIQKAKAEELFTKWIKRKLFAPNKIRKHQEIIEMKGIYIPHWTYDSDTYSAYTAQAGEYYYVTETDWVEENGKRKMVTKRVRKTRWYPVSGDYSVFFDDILINASKNVDNEIINKIEPFHFNELVKYKPDYLSGFGAERYSVDLNEGWKQARDNIDGSIRHGVTQKINADEVRSLRVNTTYKNITYKHLLLPIWISSYKHGKKAYNFMVNGQTGEVQGKAPVSALKVIGTILAVAAIVTGIVFLKQYMGW